MVKEIVSAIAYSLFLIMSILTLIFITNTSKSIAISIYIIYSLGILSYSYFIILFILKKINSVNEYCFGKIKNIILCLLIIALYSEPIVFLLNYSSYIRYQKICAFTLGDMDIKLHLKKRCDLYNINTNSRYSYQYICSYNPTDELKNFELSKKEFETSNKLDIIRCLPIKNLLNNNIVISEFAQEYEDKEKYYCNIVYKPVTNKFIGNVECNKNRYALYKLSCSFLLLQLFFITISIVCLKNKEINNNNNLQREIDDSALFRYGAMLRLFSLNRMLMFLRELMNNNNVNASDSNVSTQKSERENDNDNNFVEEKTKNIIIDNNIGLEVDVNIKNLYKENKDENNSIQLGQINLSINSDENSMKNVINSKNNDI